MANLTHEKPIDQIGQYVSRIQVPVKGDAVLYEGALVELNGGYARRAGTAGTVYGVAAFTVDATGKSDGALSIDLLEGVFAVKNAAANAVATAHIGSVVYAADDQTVANTGTVPAGMCLGFTEDGDVIVAIHPTQNYIINTDSIASQLLGAGGSDLVLYDGTDTVQDALNEVYATIKAELSVDIPLGSFVLAATGLPMVAVAATSVPGFALADSKAMGIKWLKHETPGAVTTAIPVPSDLDNEEDAKIEVIASKIGATAGDVTKFTIGAFNNAVGAVFTADADYGGDTGAMTGDATTKTVQKVSLELSAADLPAADGTITLTLKPKSGTLGTDDVIVHAVRFVYTPTLAAP